MLLQKNQKILKNCFLESYGYQMNFSDSEIVASILNEQGYNTTMNVEEADLILLNTCSIRERAEQTVRMHLQFKKFEKKGLTLLLVFLVEGLNVLKLNFRRRTIGET